MEKYRFLDHTADAKFQSFGRTLEDAYVNAGFAMFSIITDVKKVKPVYAEEIFVRGKDLVSLLYNFLEELLFLFDTKGIMLSRVVEIDIHNFTLHAVIEGDINHDEYEMCGSIKAVTYNEMEVREEDGHFVCQVVVDI
jgi:SHS2 domain-containing protein